jgi:hypothetical protein
MNLFCHKDNFLSLENFNKLSQTAVDRYPIILNEDKNAKQNMSSSVRSREPSFPAGYTTLPAETAVRYGLSAIIAVEQTRELLINEFHIKNPEIANIWFAYMNADKKQGWHCDGPVRDFPVEKCLTVCLYLHSTWEPAWGGEIITESGNHYEPKPNRLVVWSRDITHRVAPIFTPDPNYMRMVMATTWTSEGQLNDIQ